MFGLDTDTLRNIKDYFAQLPNIEKVLIYGSRAKGNYRNGSDIDITLIGANLSLDNSVYPLMEVLEDSYIPYEFDISIFNQLDNPDFISHILRIGKIFYQKENTSLPVGWEMKKLDALCDVEYGTRVVRKRDGGTIHPVYGGGGATFFMDTFNREDCLVVARFAMSEKCTRFVNGKFFLKYSGLSVKQKDTDIISQEFLNKYFIFLNDYIYSLARGAAQKNLNVPAFRKLEILYPKSISQQKQIVAILDKVFAAIDTAKANAKQNLQNAKELFESYLQNVFENKGDDWEDKPLKEVCESVFAGGDKPKGNFSKEKTEDYTISIYANAVKKRGLYGYTNKARVLKPSVTIAARGSGTGHTELRKESFYPIVRLIVVIPNSEIIDLQFLKHSIDNLDILRSGSAIPQLTVPMMKKYIISYPSIEKQKHIVQKLNALSTQTKKLELIYRQKIANLEELKKSVLQKAFSGQLLVVND